MLPPSYALPAAIVLVLGGALACFAGYRLFKFVLAIYGFIFGAMFASSMVAASSTAGMIGAAVVGGLIGAAILTLAYFVGIALVGAGLGVFAMQSGWARYSAVDPPWVLVLLFAALGTVTALVLQRYVIVVATAFGGAWTIIIGVLSLIADRRAAGAASDVWILYPTSTLPGGVLVPVAWVVLGLLGTGVQLGVSGRKR
jgi:hypothetical protein